MAREVLSLGQVRIHSGSATREEAMKEAADILEAAGAVTSAYFDAMQQREQTVSTYMGNELAIPHGTNETKHTILDSALSVVRYDGGVDWGGEPVTFVVGIAGKGDEHLEILSQIAILFSDEDDVAQAQGGADAGGALRAWSPRPACHEGRPLRRRATSAAASSGCCCTRAATSSSSRMSRPRSSTRSTPRPSTPCTRWARAAATGRDRLPRDQQRRRIPSEVVDEIATANVVTTAVGPTILKFVAPHIVAGLALRDPVGAAAADHGVRERHQRDRPAPRRDQGARRRRVGRARLAAPCSRTPPSTGSCPPSPKAAGVDVTVEPFFEWAIERPPFGDDPPRIPGAHFVDDLAPYIERKLFTVNTGHATTAYFGAAGRGREDLGRPRRRRDRRARRGGARRDLGAARGQARPRPGGARRLPRDDPAAASATRRCPTRCGASAASRCASCRATSGSSAPRPKRPSAASPSTRSSARWARRSRSTTPRTSSRWTCSGCCANRMPRPSPPRSPASSRSIRSSPQVAGRRRGAAGGARG